MARTFADPPPAPPAGPFSYRSILPSFSVWGWTFTTDHQVTEFTYLAAVSHYGLVVKGSGTLEVTTAALYPPKSKWTVTQAGSAPVVVTADHAGGLRFAVNLGPQHTAEQTGFDTGDETAGWMQATVSIARAK